MARVGTVINRDREKHSRVVVAPGDRECGGTAAIQSAAAAEVFGPLDS